MFIASQKNIKVKRKDGSAYTIKKDFVGEIPDDVAAHWLVQAAIKSGSIAAPQGKKDKDLEAAESIADDKAAEADIRTDSEDDKKAEEKKKTRK